MSIQAGRGGMGISKHRQANVHKVAKSRYVYEHIARLLNKANDEQVARIVRRRSFTETSVVALVERFRPR